MGEQYGRSVRPRWPAVTRTSVPSSLLPTLLPAPGSPAFAPASSRAPRLRSPRHLDLVETLADGADWASTALHACLAHLLVSTVTEARRVWVVDAWAEPDDSFCVVYRPPLDEGRVVGLRRTRAAALEPTGWAPGDMTTWGYDMGADIEAEAFGWNVADFDVGEPLGFVTTVLRYDAADIGWWGNLGDDLPEAPRG